MPPQNTPANNDPLIATAIVVGTFAAMWTTDKVLDKLTRIHHKRRVLKEVRSWSRTWMDIDNLPEMEK